MSGLESQTVTKIKQCLAEVPEIDKAILYGSRAKGNYKTGSDIDLTLFGNGLTMKLLYMLQEKLDNLYLPYTFDLSIFVNLENPDLIDHIQRVGVVFYEKKEGIFCA